MARRQAVTPAPAESAIALVLSARERAALLEMAAATHEADLENVLRSALWRYGRHLDRKFTVDIFALRRVTGTGAESAAQNEKADQAGPPGIEAAPHVTDAGH